jgi:hypothetical protein
MKFFEGETGRVLDSVDDKEEIARKLPEKGRLTKLGEDGLKVVMHAKEAQAGPPQRSASLQRREERQKQQEAERLAELENFEREELEAAGVAGSPAGGSGEGAPPTPLV